ncbi:hypothetical protein QR680_000764 [Steinernema hermaphroditum]|uniref:Uncharacterized protein n=1 Tax=Steinernema hermaphroditum TaxID=289476 RepID=A0AA39GVT1_9BILA|nr:hypothetical protein QR680_000764 [Steinernema hermaphroditum]
MNGRSDTNDHFELVNVEKALGKHKNSVPMAHRTSSDNSAFEKDPFNQPELVITLRGRELVLFVIGYIFAVFLILALFESVMPVIFTGGSQTYAYKK